MSQEALISHLLSQTEATVSFLATHNYISQADAADITSRLSGARSRVQSSDTGLASSMQALSVAPVPPAGFSALSDRRSVPPPPQPRSRQARAIWGYNEDGVEPNDLSFASGEIIEIIDENNSDWWTGRCRGRQGLFPSNHVEATVSSANSPAPAPTHAPVNPMSPPSGPPPSSYAPPPAAPASYAAPDPYAAPAPYAPAQYGAPPTPNGYSNDKPVYRPFGATYQANDQPPPPATAATNSVGLQQAPGQEHKKSKFGRLGNTMANSAAGGVGFGAGAAIGGGIINAIF